MSKPYDGEPYRVMTVCTDVNQRAYGRRVGPWGKTRSEHGDQGASCTRRSGRLTRAEVKGRASWVTA